MVHPLENYRIIASPNFIQQMEYKFYDGHFAKLEKDGLHVFKEEDKNRIMVMGVDLEGNGFGEYISFSSFFLSEYNSLEKESRLEVDKTILAHLQEDKQQVFVKAIIAELQVLQDAISKLELEPKHEVYKSILLDKVIAFSKLIENIYLPQNQKLAVSTPTQPTKKLRWMGNTNILTTLFYDLINGIESAKIPRLIDADAPEIEAFIITNFIDKDGNDFPPKSTINTNLKPNKQQTKRAANGKAIDLGNYYKPE
jgi:hypothetical protein